MLYKDSCQECPGCCVKEDWGLVSVFYKGLQVYKSDLSCTWVLYISRACLDYTPEVWHWPLLSPAQSGRWRCLSGSQLILNWFFLDCSDQGWIWSTGARVQLPWNPGCSAAGFLSESVSSSVDRYWEYILQARRLQMQNIIGFKMSLAEHIMDILWILWLVVVFCWPVLPSWCNS